MTLPPLPTSPRALALEAEVLGRDTRALVADTTGAPFRYICHLTRPIAGGERMGTGTVIGPRTVLTAAHVLLGADPTDIVVTPARNGRSAPFGSTRGRSASFWYPAFTAADIAGPRDIALL